jgi:hypothetical protein
MAGFAFRQTVIQESQDPQDTMMIDLRPSHGLKGPTSAYLRNLVEHFCVKDDLSTYDPYDIWKTRLGLQVKCGYNSRPYLALAPAGLLALVDNVLDNRVRLFYQPKEYAVVRAMAALCLVNLYGSSGERRLILAARRHIEWLIANSCSGFSGHCWGLGVTHAATRDIVYNENTPFSTITPYALEAVIAFNQVFKEKSLRPVIDSIFTFFDSDIKVMEEDSHAMATSYGPFKDRTVINAVTYTMYAYSLLLPHVPRHRHSEIQTKIGKLYEYVRRHQRPDGSWLYSPHGRSFIDCFHSCIVLKNIVKTHRLVGLPDAPNTVAAGYEYIKKAFLNEQLFLFTRFAVKNKPGLVKFDLYDNAEVLNLSVLLGDTSLAMRLVESIMAHFCRGFEVYSQIDYLGFRRKKNTLRWAVMPFLHAASSLLEKGADLAYQN